MTTPRTPLDQLERDLRAAGRRFEVTVSPDAWQRHQRRLASSRERRRRGWLGVAAAAVLLMVAATVLATSGGGPDAGPPAGRGADPWDSGNLLGRPVTLETYRVDGVDYVHEAALSDGTGDGPELCDRTTAGDAGEAAGCTSRDTGADDPGVAIDWLMGTEGRGDLRGVTAAVDSRVLTVQIWMDNGDMTTAELKPTGWEDTKMFALTVPAEAPRPQRLVASGRDGNVLQAVDVPARFGDAWLRARSACAGNPVVELVPDGDQLPNAHVTVGTQDALVTVRLATDDSARACIERLRADALAGWYPAGSLAVAVVAPEVAVVQVVAAGSGADRLVEEVAPAPVPGTPWRVATLRGLTPGDAAVAQIIALDDSKAELDRQFLAQPPTP